MRGQQPSSAPEKKLPGGKMSMKEIWAEAAKSFEDICGKSLQNGDMRNFDDVRIKIESGDNAGTGDGPDPRWDKAKSMGLECLKYLKLLVGAASQASSLIPLPSFAVSITSNALYFVFDIPQAIHDYNDAINEVFGKISLALSKFKIYESMDNQNIDALLIENIHRVMITFVQLCAHVVQYKQGRKRDRLKQKAKKSIFDDDSGLSDKMTEFELAVQQTRDIEGTITLATVVDSRQDIKMILEKCLSFGRTTEETHKGVQSLSDDADRIKTLVKIRDTLNVQSTVRLDTKTTQTCSDIYRNCLNGTGSWIWTHPAYSAWTATNDKDASHVLLLSGPPSSGKTLAASHITKKLEGLQGRKYVAHYFFPTSAGKSDDEKNPIQSAIKYMAFQIARVDNTVLKALGKACDANASAFRSSANLENLWGELKIGTAGSGAWYYFVFDGLENLPDRQVEMLLKFLLSPKMAGESAGRVHFLLGGTDNMFANIPKDEIGNTARIRMEQHSIADMRIIIDDALNSQEMMKNAKPNSNQQKAKDKIIEKLPKNAKGSYYLLQLELDEVVRLLSTRRAPKELERMLDQKASSHEVAIKKLQRSLMAEEISELNELLKWVLFSKSPMNLDQLEAAMFLYSSTESLASLQYIIKNKYSAVLRLEGTNVYGQDGIKDYLSREEDSLGKSSHSKDRPTISMTITINNVDQELCGHFLWDLAHKAIRDKFVFDFDASSDPLLHGGKLAIAVDEFQAHHTIVTRAFEYLGRAPADQTRDIGEYLVRWLPHHLSRLRHLEDEEKGELAPHQKLEIGRNLYALFQNEKLLSRHRASFEKTFWTARGMEDVRKWLMDPAVVRKLDRKWRDKVQSAVSPTRGYLEEFVKIVVTGFLQDRTWDVRNASSWIVEFMMADSTTPHVSKPLSASADDAGSSSSLSSSANDNAEIDWERLSTWCQDFLGLDSNVNSLWYERLAAAAALRGSPADVVRSLYGRALEKENPSWLCHSGLGRIHFRQYRTSDAIREVEEALRIAEKKDAVPTPKKSDLMDLHLLLGRFYYEADDTEEAASQYSVAWRDGDGEQAEKGQLGYLKSILNLSYIEGKREMLEKALDLHGEERKIVRLMRMIARDVDHDAIVSKMFSSAKESPELLREIVHAMERATKAAFAEDRTAEVLADDRFIEDEYCGMLLYDMGVAAYSYKVSPEGTEPIDEALKLWRKSRDQLSNVGGRNAYSARRSATTALAKHYFQSMLDGQYLDHLDELSKLANDSSETFLSDPPGFLSAFYALCDKKEESKSVLLQRMRQALHILFDDTPDNDFSGYLILQKTLEQHQDFRNSAIALSLVGQADLVTECLCFEAEDIPDEDGVNKEQVLETVNRLAKETIQEVKAQVLDASRQAERIKAAKAHVDSLVAAAKPESKPRAYSDNATIEEDEGDDKGNPHPADPNAATALRVLLERIGSLQAMHSPEIDQKALRRIWFCDGRDADGNPCKIEHGLETEMFHCVYCSNQDFCGDCLRRLRDPASEVEITACSDRHRWLRVPPLGEDIYVGSKAKSVRVPTVKALEGDERILNIYYGEDGGEEIKVEAWLEMLAVEWGISVAALRGQAAQSDESEGERG
ncbi:hypothetical protein GGS24DRAFT_307538 [Hypoxylon argillaceum]|nr:hypothetical protein GGS24DRAFT_307538 [Hypoxylon argillaceum]